MRFRRIVLSICLALLLTVVPRTTPSSAQEGQGPIVERSRDLPLARASTNPGDTVMLQLAFECMKFQGDCGKLRVLNPPRGQNKLWLQATGVSPEKALRGDVVKDGVFTIKPGTFVNVKIAYVNGTDTEVRFRAIPHAADPYELQRLTLLNCMCLGEAYRVPPGKGWFRIIRVGAAQDIPPGSRIRVTHVLTSDGLEPSR